MVPELPVTMLACARLGVIHSEVFGGFSGAACGGRIADSGSEYLITMDAYYRNGELLDHKVKAEEAMTEAEKQGHKVKKVLIWQRHPGDSTRAKTPMVKGRDFIVDELLHDYKGKIVEPVSMPAEAPLFLMYTSGTTAKPKGAQHSTGGYLSYVAGTSKYYQDIHPEDTYWCFADIGWITGHSYIVYGPLALAATSVMYEGVPTYPDPGRPWRIAERLGVNIFHTAPTTIRMLRKVGPDEPKKYNYQLQAHDDGGRADRARSVALVLPQVGKDEAVIVDTWWQTENGGFLASTLPALQPMKPGSCGPASWHLPGDPRREGRSPVPKGSRKAGNITIRNPWPGIFQTIYGDPDTIRVDLLREVQQEERQQGLARLAVLRGRRRAAGGGRLLPHPRTRRRRDQRGRPPARHQGARVRGPHGRRGRRGGGGAGDRRHARPGGRDVHRAEAGLKPSKQIEEKVSGAIERLIGKIARPKNVWIVPDMPKTRSGKIMRRVIAGISNFTSPGDITTLANPEVVETIKHHVESEKVNRNQSPRELSEAELEEIKAFGRAE